MVFRRRSNKGMVINSLKHIVDSEGGLPGGGANSNTPIATAVDVASSPFNPGDCVIGSKLTSFFLSIFIIGDSGGGVAGSQNWALTKIYQGQTAADIPAANNLGPNGIRNQIIHTEKGLVGSADGTAMAFKGVIKVPKGFQTMRQGDQWIVSIFNADAMAQTNFCIRAIFKSYR